jgi:GTPase
MEFKDALSTIVKAGKGGNGLIAFRREKYVKKGGPSGGDGGRGGDVYFLANENIKDFAGIPKGKILSAEVGHPGGQNERQGKKGSDLTIEVPVGTQIFEDGELVFDITQHNQKVMVAKGGKGGFGNAHFKSAGRQTPSFAEMGDSGDEFEFDLVLKLIAEVGIIGLPNAGKSSLISILSRAKPKVANYPFTTLSPILGIVEHKEQKLTMADTPGLIKGAGSGKGLGFKFLQHIERCGILIHLIDCFGSDTSKINLDEELEKLVPEKVQKFDLSEHEKVLLYDFLCIKNELEIYDKNFGSGVSRKPMAIVFNKIDALPDFKIPAFFKQLRRIKTFKVSAVAGNGMNKMLDHIFTLHKRHKLQNKPPRLEQEMEFEVKREKEETGKIRGSEVRKVEEDYYIIVDSKVSEVIRRIDFTQEGAKQRLLSILKRRKIYNSLLRKGIKAGDTVNIDNEEYVWSDE